MRIIVDMREANLCGHAAVVNLASLPGFPRFATRQSPVLVYDESILTSVVRYTVVALARNHDSASLILAETNLVHPVPGPAERKYPELTCSCRFEHVRHEEIVPRPVDLASNHRGHCSKYVL